VRTLGKALRMATFCAFVGAFGSCSMQAPTITAPRYALVYGVQAYLERPLKYTVYDAQGMESKLKAQGWASASFTEREDGAVTKAQIKADILSLRAVSSNSTVLFYFSGHGTYADSTWGQDYPTYSGAYIVPYDAVTSAYGLSELTNLISPAELQSWLAQLGTKNVIVILDCCNSGAFGLSRGATDASPQDYSSMQSYSAFSTALANFGSLLVANASASGAKTPIVLSGAGSLESDYDGSPNMAHGVFTYYLLEAATKGDSDGDGVVTTTEAYAYAAKSIKAWGASLTIADYYDGVLPFLPHISGDTRDLVLFSE
jgi:hypothetical protein